MGRLAHLVKLAKSPSLTFRAKYQVILIGARREMRKLGLPPRATRWYEINLKSGTLFVPPRDVVGDVVIFNEVFLDESYESSYGNSVVIDLGGHRGYFGAYALAMGAKRVYSFEPEPRNFEILRRCADTFGASGHEWIIENSAVADRDGEAEFFVADESYNHSLHATEQEPGLGRTKVRVRSFAAILQGLDLKNRRVIAKLDIEGSECEVILSSGAQWDQIDEVFMEFHEQGRCSADGLIERLSSFGLTCVARSLVSADRHFYRFSRRDPVSDS